MEYKTRDEEIVDESVLDRTIKFVESERFSDSVERFRRENMKHFEDFAESKTAEYNLQHTIIFEKYQSLLDKLFGEFSSDIGVSSKEIYQNCRDVVDGKFTALFEEHEHKWFVDLVMSWMSFEMFVREMCNQADSGGKSFRK